MIAALADEPVVGIGGRQRAPVRGASLIRWIAAAGSGPDCGRVAVRNGATQGFVCVACECRPQVLQTWPAPAFPAGPKPMGCRRPPIRLPPKAARDASTRSRRQSGRSAHSFILEAGRKACGLRGADAQPREGSIGGRRGDRTTPARCIARTTCMRGWNAGPRSGCSTAEAVATVGYSARALSHSKRALKLLQARTGRDDHCGRAIRSAVENLARTAVARRRVHANIRELVISSARRATSAVPIRRTAG